MDKDQKHAAAWDVAEEAASRVAQRRALEGQLRALRGLARSASAEAKVTYLSLDLDLGVASSARLWLWLQEEVQSEVDRLGEELEHLLAFHSEAGEH